ncbi:hypothetical protein JOF53_007143 [Crossiella equi]|uniref:Lipoprotein n=1 Tax=Crossiella equi TaxID=130796 RepID=A0ABS5ANY9_9PSEU|nr:hypothetical protein [Crossiella equi]MBP2478271.1 hypothetical protein [Crossiella equi]
MSTVKTRLGALGAAALLVLAAGCSSARTGTALADQQAVAAYMSGQFDVAFKKLDELLVKPRDEKSTVYWHGRFNERKSDKEIDVFRYQAADKGSPEPPAIFTKSRTSKDTKDNLDQYHPSGSEWDYVLLGERFRSLAPTPWVRFPTFTPKEGFNVCLLTGVQTLCAMQDAMKATQKSSPAGLLKEYRQQADGSAELLTGVTLKAFLDARVMNFEQFKSQITPPMLESFIRTTVVLDPTGNLKKIEMNGIVEKGGPKIEVQVGYEILGKATAKDFPPEPSALDRTDLPSREARSDFFNRLAAL